MQDLTLDGFKVIVVSETELSLALEELRHGVYPVLGYVREPKYILLDKRNDTDVLYNPRLKKAFKTSYYEEVKHPPFTEEEVAQYSKDLSKRGNYMVDFYHDDDIPQDGVFLYVPLEGQFYESAHMEERLSPFLDYGTDIPIVKKFDSEFWINDQQSNTTACKKYKCANSLVNWCRDCHTGQNSIAYAIASCGALVVDLHYVDTVYKNLAVLKEDKDLGTKEKRALESLMRRVSKDLDRGG